MLDRTKFLCCTPTVWANKTKTVMTALAKPAASVCIITVCTVTMLGITLLDRTTAHAQDRACAIVGAEARSHWDLAMAYKYERRYELARQHLLMALMCCETTESRDILQREIQLVDFKIRTLR